MIRYFAIAPGFFRVCLFGWKFVIVSKDRACFSERQSGHPLGGVLVCLNRIRPGFTLNFPVNPRR